MVNNSYKTLEEFYTFIHREINRFQGTNMERSISSLHTVLHVIMTNIAGATPAFTDINCTKPFAEPEASR